MTRHGIELDSQPIRDFCKKWKIKELSVFGSILRDDFSPESDVDFLVDFDNDSEWDLFDGLDMHDELSELVGRKIDIVSRNAIETDDNRFIKKEIFTTAEAVHGKR